MESVIRKLFYDDIASLIISYVKSDTALWFTIGLDGDYERSITCPHGSIKYVFQGACQSGHIQIVKAMMSRGRCDVNLGLKYALSSFQSRIVKLMLRNGATNYEEVLIHAATCGNLKWLKQFLRMQEYLPRDIEHATNMASKHNHAKCMKVLFEYGGFHVLRKKQFPANFF